MILRKQPLILFIDENETFIIDNQFLPTPTPPRRGFNRTPVVLNKKKDLSPV